MAWQQTTAKWIARVFYAFMCMPVVQILVLNVDGWETMFSPPLQNEREIAIARIGVLFDHGFQASTWLAVILMVELGNLVMLRAALFTSAFAMSLNGVYGLKAYYAEACTGYDICPDDSVVEIADTMAPAIVALALVGLILSFFGGAAPTDDDRSYSSIL